MKLRQLISELQVLAAREGPEDVEVRLIVEGVAWKVEQVWWEARQEGIGAVCIGDDPR